jgi:hypothetical protein
MTSSVNRRIANIGLIAFTAYASASTHCRVHYPDATELQYIPNVSDLVRAFCGEKRRVRLGFQLH